MDLPQPDEEDHQDEIDEFDEIRFVLNRCDKPIFCPMAILLIRVEPSLKCA
jgi:hypothetical protein